MVRSAKMSGREQTERIPASTASLLNWGQRSVGTLMFTSWPIRMASTHGPSARSYCISSTVRTLAEVALVVSNHGRFPMSTATLAPLMPLTAEMATFTITSNRSDAIFVKSLLMLCAL